MGLARVAVVNATRILVVGADGAEARAVAEAVAREAFSNVSYFDGTADDFAGIVRTR